MKKTMRKPSFTKTPYSPELADAMESMMKLGHSQNHVAKSFKVAFSTVETYIKRRNDALDAIFELGKNKPQTKKTKGFVSIQKIEVQEPSTSINRDVNGNAEYTEEHAKYAYDLSVTGLARHYISKKMGIGNGDTVARWIVKYLNQDENRSLPVVNLGVFESQVLPRLPEEETERLVKSNTPVDLFVELTYNEKVALAKKEAQEAKEQIEHNGAVQLEQNEMQLNINVSLANAAHRKSLEEAKALLENTLAGITQTYKSTKEKICQEMIMLKNEVEIDYQEALQEATYKL